MVPSFVPASFRTCDMGAGPYAGVPALSNVRRRHSTLIWIAWNGPGDCVARLATAIVQAAPVRRERYHHERHIAPTAIGGGSHQASPPVARHPSGGARKDLTAGSGGDVDHHSCRVDDLLSDHLRVDSLLAG